MTQNIDNLEEGAGIDMSDVIQCHGHSRTVECAKCLRTKSQKVREQWRQAVYAFDDSNT